MRMQSNANKSYDETSSLRKYDNIIRMHN